MSFYSFHLTLLNLGVVFSISLSLLSFLEICHRYFFFFLKIGSFGKKTLCFGLERVNWDKWLNEETIAMTSGCF